MSEKSTARRVQRALGVAYSTALMWVRNPQYRAEAGATRLEGESFADKLVAIILMKHPPKEKP